MSPVPRAPDANYFFCGVCGTKHATREDFTMHKHQWDHKGRQALATYAAKGWTPVASTLQLDKGDHLLKEKNGDSTASAAEITVTRRGDWIRVRTSISIFQEAGIPHATGEHPDPNAYVDQFGRGAFATYVPRTVADAVKEWLALPAKTKRAQHLGAYLKEMFAEVDWLKMQQDDIARTVANQEPFPTLTTEGKKK